MGILVLEMWCLYIYWNGTQNSILSITIIQCVHLYVLLDVQVALLSQEMKRVTELCVCCKYFLLICFIYLTIAKCLLHLICRHAIIKWKWTNISQKSFFWNLKIFLYVLLLCTWLPTSVMVKKTVAGAVLGMGSADEKRRYIVTSPLRRYIVTSSLISWAHNQKNPCVGRGESSSI